MRRHPLLLVIAVVILALGATPALAALAPLGGPLASHSWSQRFEESGVGDYDHVQLHMISGPSFALPTAQSGFSVSGWAQGSDDGSNTTADGPATALMQWDVTFSGTQATPFSFLFQAWDGAVLKESIIATWNGSAWSFAAAPSGAWPGGDLPFFGADEVVSVTGGLCLSSVHTCVTVPMMFNRVDATPARGISVTFQLSGDLALCGAGIVQGSWLTGYSTDFRVVDNGAGSYTVDQVILGLPCGAIAGGQLFTLDVGRAPLAVDGTGTITVTAVDLRDCDNAPLPGLAGAPGLIPIDFTAPIALTALGASQVKTGNDTDGTTKITVSWPAVESGATVHVYRAGFGSYPEYDDASGAVPSYPAVGSWVLAGNVTSGTTLVDEPAARDFWYYVALVEDACGNVGPVSNQTGGTLNYHLGDVADGVTDCAGNNAVWTEDISLLGGNYGVTLGYPDALACLDVGPTTNYSVNARPLTDNKVNFEDLMMFAINYNLVSGPQDAPLPVAVATSNRLWLEGPAEVSAGATFTVQVQAACAGDLQGLSLQLAWNHAVAEPVSVEAGGLATLQNGVVFSSGAGNVDAALLGANRGLAGEGVLATVTFRALASGAPNVTLAKVDARDATNQPVELAGVKPAGPVTTETALMPAAPNPFSHSTTLGFRLAKPGPVMLAIYSVDGRCLRTLVDEMRAAGPCRVAWDGTDEHGNPLRPGMFFARLVTGQERLSRTVLLVR